ncbi:MAG: uroporphyrinogen-III synthase, partial [Aquificaceae bacterium]|nr:uroporphyrinogen-III synthase [Aquificaceae bacterium]
MKVALTRTPEDVEKDRKTFERAGFEVVAIPLLEEVPMDFEVPELYFDFVVFQSARAVRHFLSRHRLRNEKVLVVGEKTRREVESFGYKVWAMPEKYYGEELLKLFKGLSGRVLVPRSAVGREELIEGLKSLGLEVYPLDIYAVRERTYEKEELLG